MENRKHKEGFVLLIVIVLISAVLVVGLSIFDIILRELLFSSLGRESLKAFYAADSGVECARYWDSRNKFAPPPYNYTINCAGDENISGEIDQETLTTTFTVKFDNGACAEVYVYKGIPSLETKIVSRGYNMACDSDSPKKVERGTGLDLIIDYE